MSKYPYIIIIGCGSSGTRFTATLLQRIGVDVRHEYYGEDGIASWYLTPGPGSVARPPHGGPTYEGIMSKLATQGRRHVVIHQFRNPIKSISTFQRAGSKSWNFIFKHLCWIGWDTPLPIRSMTYWLYWNSMAETLTRKRIQVERIGEEFGRFCKLIGRPSLVVREREALDIPKTVNSRVGRYEPLTWNDLMGMDEKLTVTTIKKGMQYGYCFDAV